MKKEKCSRSIEEIIEELLRCLNELDMAEEEEPFELKELKPQNDFEKRLFDSAFGDLITRTTIAFQAVDEKIDLNKEGTLKDFDKKFIDCLNRALELNKVNFVFKIERK